MEPSSSVDPKFSGRGLVQLSALQSRLRDSESAEALTTLANFGLAGRTWATYGSAVNNLRRCEEETGIDMSLPFGPNKVLEFVAWMKARNLKSKTMSSYLSGVRMYHIASGYAEGLLREPLVKLILKGQDNWDKLQDRIGGK